MKKLILSILFLGLFLIGTSQESLKNKLLEVYSAEITNGILENCQKKNYYSNLIFHSYTLIKFKKEKKDASAQVIKSLNYKNNDGTITVLSPKKIIEMINNGSFNIMRIKLPRDLKKSTSYILGNTFHSITLFSQEYINNLTKKQKC